MGRKLLKFILNFGVKPEDRYGMRSKKAGNVIVTLGLVALAVLLLGPVQIAYGEALGGWLTVGLGLALFANLIIFGLTHKNLEVWASIQYALTHVYLLIYTLAMGGLLFSVGMFLFGIPVLIGAVINLPPRQAVVWFMIFVATIITIAAFQPALDPAERLPVGVQTLLLTIATIVVSLEVFGIISYFATQNTQAFQQVRAERNKSEGLLLNILPTEIAAILKNEQRTIADSYEGASILFADVVNFTPLSSQMSPIALVEMLNEVFSYFDTLVEKYGLEKIKTIGDCYMVASGVPRARPDHAEALVRMALEMQEYVSKHTFGDQRLSFRIGINSGPVVAGVIGQKKFIYDLWGDAVNTASRMESHGVEGSIQITRSTQELIDGKFVCEPRGCVEVKGKGAMDVWHVIGETGKAP